MDKLIRLFLCFCLLHANSLLFAESYIESKQVKKSHYFNNEANGKMLTPYKYQDWLEHRISDKEPKDIMNIGYIIDDTEILRPLYAITNQLLTAWPGDVPDMAIFVISSPNYSGATLIANELIVTTTVLQQVKSDDELAAILAHELSHVLLKHNKNNKLINTMEKLFDTYESIKIVKELFQGVSVDKNNQDKYEIDINESVVKGLMQASAQKRRASEFYNIYNSTFFKRGAERDADKLAVDLMAGSGYAPSGLKDAIYHIGSSFEVENLVSTTLNASAHTLTGGAQQQLSIALAQYKSTDSFSGSGDLLQQVRDNMKSTLKQKAKKIAFSYFKNSHPASDKRREAYVDYLKQNYGRKVRNKPKSHEHTESYQNGQLAHFLNNQYAAIKAYGALAADDYLAAERFAKNSIQGPTTRDAFTRSVAFQVRLEQNKFDLAALNVERIGSMLNLPNTRFAEMGMHLLNTGKTNLVTTALEDKEKYGGTIAQFYPLKIRLALKADNGDKAKNLALACINDKNSTPQTLKGCNRFNLLTASEQEKPGLWDVLKKTTSTLNSLTQ